MSQYYKACFVPRMVKEKDLLLKQMLDMFATLQPLIAAIKPEIPNYVIDFAFNESLDKVCRRLRNQ
jgi:hypothetical protein